jgi:hypothetical protein
VRQIPAAAGIVSTPAERPIYRGAKLSEATAMPPSRVPRVHDAKRPACRSDHRAVRPVES